MFVQLFVALVMMIVSAALQASMQPKPKSPESGKLDVPLAQDGDVIPVAFGTNVAKTSNVNWYGDSGTTPIYSSGGGKK